MASIKIKKSLLIGLASWLNEQKLGGAVSRSRTRFVQILSDEIQKTDKERDEMIEKIVNKNEDGTRRKIEAVDNEPERWDIDADKLPGLETEYADLLNEEFVIDVTDANRMIISQVRDILLNTDYRFGPSMETTREEVFAKVRQMNDYPVWCETFEGVDLNA